MKEISIEWDAVRQRITKKALVFGDEAFQNALEKVVVLNPRVTHWTQETNAAWNVLGDVLVEYNVGWSKHKVLFIPEVNRVPMVTRAPDV